MFRRVNGVIPTCYLDELTGEVNDIDPRLYLLSSLAEDHKSKFIAFPELVVPQILRQSGIKVADVSLA
jgi:hypothetical protein